MSQTKAQLLNPLGDLDLTGQLTGVGATFTGNIRAVDGIFSGNVSVAGTLTKEDVTNVDSVGLITARSGIDVTGGDIKIPDKLVHLGDTDTAIRFAGADIVTIETGGTERLRVDSAGLKITDKLIHFGDTDTFLEFGTDTISFDTGGSERLRINSDGYIQINNTNIQKKLSVKETSTTSGVYYNAVIGGASHLAGYAVGIGFDPESSNARCKTGIVAEGTGDGYSRAKLHFLLDSANDSGEATLTESRMTIIDSGGVGIGTNIPIKKFDVRGTGNQGILIGSYDNSGAQLIIDGNGNGDAGGGNYGALEHKSNGDLTIRNHDASQSIILGAGSASGANDSLVINSSQNATFAGTVSDSKGDVRSIPMNTQSSAYTLVAADVGKCISISSGGVTVPNNVFSAGDAVTIINNSGSDQTITATISTLYNSADAATGNRTLAGRGIATIWFRSGGAAYISGSGLS